MKNISLRSSCEENEVIEIVVNKYFFNFADLLFFFWQQGTGLSSEFKSFVPGHHKVELSQSWLGRASEKRENLHPLTSISTWAEPFALLMQYCRECRVQYKWPVCAVIMKLHLQLARKWDSLTKCESGIWFAYSLVLLQHLCRHGQMSFWLLNLTRCYHSVHVLTWISATLSVWVAVSALNSGRKESLFSFVLSDTEN